MAEVDPKPEEKEEEPAPEEAPEEEKPGEPAEETTEDPEAKGEGEEEEGGEPPEEAEEAKKGEEPEPEEKRKRAGGWQRRIDRLERQNQQLLDQLGAQRPGVAAGGAEPGKEQTPEEKAAAYIDGLVETRLAKREEQKRRETVVAEFNRRTAEVRAARPDWDDVIESVAHIPASQALQEALLTSEHGPEIMYQLASSPAELARLSALPPIVAAREVGRLEAKLTSVAPAPVKPKAALRPPVPPTSVTGSASKTRDLDALSLSDYKRAMRSGRR